MVKVIVESNTTQERIEWAFMEADLNKDHLFKALSKIVGKAVTAPNDALYGDLIGPVEVIDKDWDGADIILSQQCVGTLCSVSYGELS